MLMARLWPGIRRSSIWPGFLSLAFLMLACACGGSKDQGSRTSANPPSSGTTLSHEDRLTKTHEPESPAAGLPRAGLAAVDGPGLVYGYGKRLERPYIFIESDDGRTLYLNDLVYDGPAESTPPEIVVTETVRSQHELSVMAYEYSKRARTYEERRAIYAEVLRGSDLVKDVKEFSQGVYVTWRSSPDEEEVIIPSEESHFDLAEFRRRLISEFRATVDSGGMIAFGERYHIHVPPGRVAATVEQLERLRSGAGPEEIDIGTTILRNRNFLNDLYRAVPDTSYRHR
jgi:hypothetical protein